MFAPTTPGIFAGTLTFTDNATGGTQTTNLTGIGIDFSLTATGATSITVSGAGGTATYPLQLTSLAGLTGNVALSCSGAPANSVCTVTPGVAQLGGTTLVSATIDVGVASVAAASSRQPWNSRSLIVFALLVPVAFITRRRRISRLALSLVLMATLGVLSGCGANRTIPTPTSGGTTTPAASGAYTFTVSATSAGLTHAVNLTLVVQ